MQRKLSIRGVAQYGFNLCARWHQRLWFKIEEFEGIGSVWGIECCKIPGTLPIHLLSHFCCRMYRLINHNAQRHRQTDRQTIV